MTDSTTAIDQLRAILVLAATIGTSIFNWLALTGRVNNSTSAAIFDYYPTFVTPASYAFAIWSLIFFWLVVFSIYQLLSANLARLRNIRLLFIISCVLNCVWLFVWQSGFIGISLIIITGQLFVLFTINWRLRRSGSINEYWAVKAPFSIYFGWVSAISLVNFAVFLKYLNVELSDGIWTTISIILIIFAATVAAIVRFRLSNYLFPLSIAWTLTAIGVKQSGQTLVVATAAIGTIVCLIATLSLVVNLPSTETARPNE